VINNNGQISFTNTVKNKNNLFNPHKSFFAEIIFLLVGIKKHRIFAAVKTPPLFGK